MSVLVVGLNHRSADLALLERVAVPAEEHAKALKSLVGLEHVVEAVVLSTCNRVEIYAHVTRFHNGVQEIRDWLAERADVHPQDIDDLLYSYYEDRAAAHLFAVAGGIDSMVVGEQQIAMQVKDVMELAREEGTARRVLQRLFRQAVRVGRRIRQDTAISKGASSMVDVGLAAATRRLDDGSGEGLSGRTVLIVGAGKMGGLTAARLDDAGIGKALVWNRSEDKAQRLAAKVDGVTVDGTELGSAIAQADLVVCTTGAPMPVIDRELVGSALSERTDGRPLVLLDLAMPRNVDPACDDFPGVTLVDLGHVRDEADRTVTGEVIAEARAIVDEEAARFHAWTQAVKVEPTIRSLRSRADMVRRAELERLSSKLSTLDDKQREAVESLTRGIINTLLHDPTVRLKELADSGGAEHHANALRELFDLDE